MFNISKNRWQFGFQLHLDTGTLKPTFFNPYGKDRSHSWIFHSKNFVFKQKIGTKNRDFSTLSRARAGPGS